MLYAANSQTEIFQEITRKMQYGAPELKLYYRKYLISGLMVAVTVAAVLSFSILYYILQANGKSEVEVKTPDRTIDITETYFQIPVQEPPQVIQENMSIKDLASLTPDPVPVKKVKKHVTIKSQQELEEVKLPVSSEGTEDATKVNTSGNGNLLQEKKIEEHVEEVKAPPVKSNYESFEVEKSPSALNLSTVKASMDYPEIARLSEIEGRVVARVLVGTDGSVVKIGSLSGPDVFYDEVRQKVMDLQFTPAIQNSQPVKCWVSVPFSFKLSSKG